jgi:hypothetical protein
MMMEYAFDYVGVSVPEMSVRHFNEVVFELFPRKVSTEAESAFPIIAELRAFWDFVHRQHGLANARKIRDSLTDDAVIRLKKALSDPADFGMAKGIVLAGQKAGFDMSTEEGLNAFMAVYNASILGNGFGGPPPEPALLEHMGV